jgi:hypothetical protein
MVDVGTVVPFIISVLEFCIGLALLICRIFLHSEFCSISLLYKKKTEPRTHFAGWAVVICRLLTVEKSDVDGCGFAKFA